MAMANKITINWVVKPSGIAKRELSAKLICKPKKPMGPMVPAATAITQQASTIAPIGPLRARSPNNG